MSFQRLSNIGRSAVAAATIPSALYAHSNAEQLKCHIATEKATRRSPCWPIINWHFGKQACVECHTQIGGTALITGSTSGIGLGIAKEMATAGYNIVLNGFLDGPTHLEVLQREVKDASGGRAKVWYVAADLSTASGCEFLVQEAIAQAGDISVLVNNAGMQRVHAIDGFPIADWDAVIALNLSAVFYCTRAMLPHMKQQDKGRIINIASTHGLVASKNKGAYIASKHGVVGLTKTVALEEAETAVTCNCICPGYVLTPLVQKQIDDLSAREGIPLQVAAKKFMGEKVPSGEANTPAQIGAMVVFLSSSAASNCRGAAFVMDGGWTAQ